jgi:hypothetical protein
MLILKYTLKTGVFSRFFLLFCLPLKIRVFSLKTGAFSRFFLLFCLPLKIGGVFTIFSAFLFTLEHRGVFLKKVAVFTRGLSYYSRCFKTRSFKTCNVVFRLINIDQYKLLQIKVNKFINTARIIDSTPLLYYKSGVNTLFKIK